MPGGEITPRDRRSRGRPAGSPTSRFEPRRPSRRSLAGNWLRAEREHLVVHDYDTVDRDLERLGMTISRLPSEAGVVWRLTLPRRRAGRSLGAREHRPLPARRDHAADRRRRRRQGAWSRRRRSAATAARRGCAKMLETQRRALLVHDPGVRLGTSAENVRRHRVAARRSRTFLRATRAYVDPNWRRSLAQPLRRLSEATGPVRDLDVLLDHLQPELQELDEADQPGAASLMANLAQRRDDAQRRLLEALDEESYRQSPRASPSAPAPARRRRVDPARPDRAARVSRAGEDDQARSARRRQTPTCTSCGSRSSARGMPPSCRPRRATRAARSSRRRRRSRASSASTRTRPWPSRSSARRPSSTSRPRRRSSPAGSPSASSRAGHAPRSRSPPRGGGCASRGSRLYRS